MSWLERHPMWTISFALLSAGIGLNFEKVSIDSSNPFLSGVVTSLIVTGIMTSITLMKGGLRRIKFVFKNYGRRFLVIGVVFGLAIIVFNVALYEHNINYYSAVKRSTMVFGTLYGIWVLKEAQGFSEKAWRLSISAVVLLGVFIIVLNRT